MDDASPHPARNAPSRRRGASAGSYANSRRHQAHQGQPEEEAHPLPASWTAEAAFIFDSAWYASQIDGDLPADSDLFRHYLDVGWRAQLSPSPLFDTKWYLAQYADVKTLGIEPLSHYLMHGEREGRQPSALFQPDYLMPLISRYESRWNSMLARYLECWREAGVSPHPVFDSNWYLAQNPDVATAGINPLVHYLSIGAAEGRDPNPIFDTDWYTAHHQDVLAAGLNPLVHYLAQGAGDPVPLFDSDWYLEQNLEAAGAGVNPLVHYLTEGAAQGRDPHPLFDTRWYLTRAPEAASNPLAHYLWKGRVRRIDPHRLFDTNFYLAANPDVALSGREPVGHYLEVGAALGRDPNPLFDSDWYMSTYPELAAIRINPLVQYVLTGADEGRNPSPLFDTAWYRSNYPDVAAAGMNPLAHYYRHGAVEGRKPLPPAGDRPREAGVPAAATESYESWCARNDAGPGVLALQRRQVQALPYRPLISVIVPVYKVTVAVVRALIESVRAQTYPDWELCLVLAWHADRELSAYLKAEAAREPRIRLRKLRKNGGISCNSNAALQLATGEYVALLDHDDMLAPNALFEIARVLAEDPSIDLVYSDKDTIEENGERRMNPLFKPQWSPEMMLCINYLTHLSVMRTARVREIGGWDPSTDGAQDWDLFLRFIGDAQKVRHVGGVLYHWRRVASSVASGLAAKPWAADAQLRAVGNYLHTRDWNGARPRFVAENVIRIDWSVGFRPRLLIFVVGDAEAFDGPGINAAFAAAEEYGAPVTVRHVRAGAGLAEAAAAHVARSDAEVLVFLDADCTPESGWLDELVGPLQNPAISAVGGRLQDPSGLLREGGWVFPEGRPVALFRGEDEHCSGVFAAAWCYRNHLAVGGGLMAVRRSAWAAIGGFSDTAAWGRPDLDLGLRLSAQRVGRIMFNGYARAVSRSASIFERQVSALDVSPAQFARLVPEGDPFFHSELVVAGPGRPELRPGPAAELHGQDFVAEAKKCAVDYDAPAAVHIVAPPIRAARLKAPSKPLRRIAWFVPNFHVPFYGGVHTILRVADHMRRRHGVHPIFVALSEPDPEMLRVRIGRAFPELARACDVRAISNVEITPNLIEADAAVATLWVTAYAIRHLETVRHRFYFMQDYEPLFYPAGSTAGLAEATYRFGFHGICNTLPLRRLYEERGGTADHFTPAVDTAVFHRHGRPARHGDDPLLVFSYARPGHPRNCFEVVAAGLAELKKRMGGRVRILTAGAEWDPRQYGLSEVVEHLGLLSYEDTGRLYRAVDVGVVAMATRHPSYLPFELMACGALVASNHNPATSWLLQDGKNCVLFDLTRSAVADTIEAALVAPRRIARIAAEAARTIARDHNDWEAVCESIAQAMFRRAGVAAPTRRIGNGRAAA